MTTVKVSHSALLMWLLAIVAVPAVVFGYDLLFARQLTTRLGEWLYGAGQMPAFEGREILWGVVFLVGGGGTALYGLKELVAPRSLLRADDDGICLAIRGPLRRPACLPWSAVGDVAAEIAEDRGERFPVLTVQVLDRTGLPEFPWRARWGENDLLLVLASSWDRPADVVAEDLRSIRARVADGSDDS